MGVSLIAKRRDIHLHWSRNWAIKFNNFCITSINFPKIHDFPSPGKCIFKFHESRCQPRPMKVDMFLVNHFRKVGEGFFYFFIQKIQKC